MWYSVFQLNLCIQYVSSIPKSLCKKIPYGELHNFRDIPLHRAHIQMACLSRDSQVGVPKSRQPGLPRLWGAITFRVDFGLRWGLKKSCSLRRELSNGMLQAICTHGNQVDSWLLVVGSQTANLPIGPSFRHNLCFRCPNGRCKPILDI